MYLEVFNQTVAKAEKLFNLDLSDLKITVDEKPLKKAAAFYRPKTKTVHMNKIMLSTFSDESIRTTVIHEIAHHIQQLVYPKAKQSHGPEFKRIDLVLGGDGSIYVKSVKCSDKFMSILNKDKPKAQTFKYTCSGVNKCRSYEFTKNRHTRASNGSGYICGTCSAPLVLDKE